jgi:hypothetical protein
VLTISRLSRWSISYYNDTARQAKQAAMDRQRSNGGLGEYYSEGDTRVPTWLLAGGTARIPELVGLDGRAADGGSADPEIVQRWLDDGSEKDWERVGKGRYEIVLQPSSTRLKLLDAGREYS